MDEIIIGNKECILMKSKILLGSLVLLMSCFSMAVAAPVNILVERGCDKTLEALLIGYLIVGWSGIRCLLVASWR